MLASSLGRSHSPGPRSHFPLLGTVKIFGWAGGHFDTLCLQGPTASSSLVFGPQREFSQSSFALELWLPLSSCWLYSFSLCRRTQRQDEPCRLSREVPARGKFCLALPSDEEIPMTEGSRMF